MKALKVSSLVRLHDNKKRARPEGPAIKFVHQRKVRCCIRYAATSGLDHLRLNVVCSPIRAKTSPDCVKELNPSTDHLRMAVWLAKTLGLCRFVEGAVQRVMLAVRAIQYSHSSLPSDAAR